MKSFVAIAILALVACANAQIIQGPSSRSTIVGPDGSAISSVAPGGTVVAEQHPGVDAHAAPVVAAPVAYTAPVAYAAPAVVAHHAPLAYAHHGLYF